MLLSNATSGNDQIKVQNDNSNENSKTEITSVKPDHNPEKESPSKKPTKNTKQLVAEYFADIPIMIDVASCESEFNQLNADGTVFRGWANPQDVGVMQINEKYHLSSAQKLGHDIHTLEGNMAYARALYKSQGTSPWKYSAPCWNKTREVALNTVNTENSVNGKNVSNEN